MDRFKVVDQDFPEDQMGRGKRNEVVQMVLNFGVSVQIPSLDMVLENFMFMGFLTGIDPVLLDELQNETLGFWIVTPDRAYFKILASHILVACFFGALVVYCYGT